MNRTNNDTITRSSLEIISLSVSLAIIVALSLFGNFLLILAFIRNGRLRASFANKLIMSLAMADFLTAAFPLTYQLATVINNDIIRNGGFLCTVGGLTSYSFFFTSVFTLVMLSVDRFLALGFPLRYNRWMNPKTKVVIIAYPWIHGALFFILCAATLEVTYQPFDCSLSWSTRPLAFTLSIMMIHVGFPLCILIALNTWTQILVRAQNRRIMDYDSSEGARGNSIFRNRTQQAQNRRANIEFKLAKVSVVIIFVFLACWTPYVVTRTLSFVGASLSSGIKSAAAWCVHASSFVNPIIYSSLRADLRKEMFRVFGICKWKTDKSGSSGQNDSSVATRNISSVLPRIE
ncbi:melanopsin [Exaiptasia diaphana]|uniref:G-protein coupled receptors family 1 profile domain-containing protein n=1 Tax=Exaiptasia diaphana TaxID=2652724 RepID=A0A913XWE9_EXADI|nr:melanopsin [Exaiptasia diaphana]XP_028517858.1 melanopsin [Exaiptasia diaphana]